MRKTLFDTCRGKGILTSVKGVASIVLFCLLSPLSGSEPGKAAVDFLGKIREGEINLEPDGDTALHPRTSAGKVEAIRKGLKRLAGELGETPGFEVAGIREDDGFAAVIVRQTGGFDQSELQVFPVALVKRGGEWLPAPVLASFENAVAGYTVPLRKRLSKLEEWMMRERVMELDRLVSKSTERMRELIRGSMVGEELEGDDLESIMEGFLKACGEGNRAAVLGYLGGLGSPWPDDWETRKSASLTAVSMEARLDYPWRLLTAPEVIRIPVHEEKTADSGMVSLACLDPALAAEGGATEKIVLLHFEFGKDPQGNWRMDLPAALLNNDAEEMVLDADMDSDLLDRFPEKLREEVPLSGAAGPEDAAEKVTAAMKSGSPRELLGMVDLNGRTKAARSACSTAAADWWSLNEPGVFRSPVKLGSRTEGDFAVVAYQWFSVARADRFELRPLFFKKTGKGWVWIPGIASPAEKKGREDLSGWLKERESELRKSWKETLLEPSVKLAGLKLDEPVGDAEVREVAEKWLAAVESGDLARVLALTAWLGTDEGFPAKGMRNLAYELEDARQGDSRVSGIHRSGGWAVASFAHVAGDVTKHKFMPVVRTGRGLRFIPEIDLVGESGRTRKFLNRASFDRLERFVGEEKVAALAAIFKNFNKDLDER